MLVPLQIDVFDGDTETTGFALTVTILEVVAVQLFPSVTVTE